MDWNFAPQERTENPTDGVHLAETEEDFDHINDVCDEVYGREFGWLATDAQPLTKDQYHPFSAYLLARSQQQVVGFMRLVRDGEQGLPVEQFAAVGVLRGKPGERRLLECQRLMVSGPHRNRRTPGMPFGAFAALVKGCLHWSLQHGFTHVVADLFLNTSTTPIEPLRALGFRDTGIEFVDTELDEPDRSVALLLDLGELFSRPYRGESPFYRYLVEPDPAIRVYG